MRAGPPASGAAAADGPVIPDDLPIRRLDSLADADRPAAHPGAARPADARPTPPSRVRIFRIQPGFLSDVPLARRRPHPGSQGRSTPTRSRTSSAFPLGNDNPLFDFRTKGDPGGVGYSRVNSQLQLFDTSKTAMSLGLQAVTPAGLASDGLADNRGTTVVTPGFSLFHELDEGLGLQAFVSKNVPLLEPGRPRPSAATCSTAWPCTPAVTNNQADPLSNLYLSVGALGQQRADADGGRTHQLGRDARHAPAPRRQLVGQRRRPRCRSGRTAPTTAGTGG